MVDQLAKHVSISGVQRPQQVRVIEPYIARLPVHVVVEIVIEPLLLFNSTTGELVVDWPIAPQINSVMVPLKAREKKRVYFELTFGPSALSYGSTQKFCQILRRHKAGRHISGVTWKGRPTISQMMDVLIAAPWARQTLHINADEVELAFSNDGGLVRLLQKWQRAGITNLVLSLGELEDNHDLDVMIACLQLISAHTSMEVRLDGTMKQRQQIMARLATTKPLRMKLSSVVSYGAVEKMANYMVSQQKREFTV